MEEKKETVLIVHNYYQIPGGEDTVVTNEKDLLEKYGHKVILYSRDNNELKSMRKLRKILLPLTTIFNIRTYREIKRIIKREEIDIVHVHNTLNLISPSVYYAAKNMKVPIVQTVHNFRLLCPGATFFRNGHICEECIEKGLRCALKHKCYRGSRLQTLVCVLSTKFHRMTGIYKKINYICLTEFNKKKLLELNQIREKNVFVKPNFAFEFANKDLNKERDEQFVFVGRIDKLKGIEILLNAWKILGKNAPKLIICGAGPMEEWCRRYIHKNKLNIKMLGYVTNREAHEIIKNSKALILPTQWYEGFPMTIVEAFSVGTPVLCSDIGNVGSIVKNGELGYKFDATPKELVKSIDKILNKPISYDKIRSTYEIKYSASSNYQMLKKINSEIKELS